MQTRFTDYLISLCTDKSGQYLKTIKESVAAALEEKNPELGKLGGIFKGFPRQYENTSAIPQPTWKQYHDACLHLIGLGSLEYQRNAETPKPILNLMRHILTEGIKELFDSKGRFKDEIIKSLELQAVLKAYKDQPEKLLLIKQQILFSYLSEIVLANLTIELIGQSNLDVSKIQGLLRRMQKAVVNQRAEFTIFFQQMTGGRLCHSTMVEEQMAEAVKKIPINKMIDIVLVDLKENAQEKSAFWQEVLYSLQQNPNNFLYVKMLYSLLIADLDQETKVKIEGYLAQQVSNEEKISEVEDKEDSTLAVKDLISARDNALLLQRLIDEVRRLSAVPANRNFLDAVTIAQRDHEFLKTKTADSLLRNFALVAQTHQCEPEISNIVAKFRKSAQSTTLVSKMFPPTQRRDSPTSSSSVVVLKGPQS